MSSPRLLTFALYWGLVLLVLPANGLKSTRREGEEETPKVFFLGPHKTGTVSFHNFMKAHGFNSVHDAGRSCQALGLGTVEENFKSGPYPGDGEMVDVQRWVDEEHLSKFRSYVKQHDVFTDMPWFLLYKMADREFPGSKFVLATRDTESWLLSQRRAFGQHTVKPRMWVYGYGSVAGHEDRYREVYEQHARDVLSYFGPDRLGKDLMIFRLGEDPDEGVTERLNEFLGLDASKGIILGKDHVTIFNARLMKKREKKH